MILTFGIISTWFVGALILAGKKRLSSYINSDLSLESGARGVGFSENGIYTSSEITDLFYYRWVRPHRV